MKILLRGHFLDDIEPLLQREDITLVTDKAEKPDLIITHGGDGALLGAERDYPGIPKLPIRDKRTSSLCTKHSHEEIIKNLASDKLTKTELIKLVGRTDKHEIIGMNDIFVHNVNRVNAIRYKVLIDGELYLNEVASDCVGVATPHGSTAYYRSITRCIFKSGIGIAFSNSREHVDHIVLSEGTVIKLQLLRGPAFIVSDNDQKAFTFNTGETLTVTKSSDMAKMYGLDIFMCPHCRKLRHMKN